MRIRMLATILAALAAGTLSVTGPAEAALTDQPFAAQAKAAGLTRAQTAALQTEVNAYLKKMGGKQVSLNEIEFDGAGKLLVALPGEAHPRDFTSGDGTRLAYDPCSLDNNNGYFCAYNLTGYRGSELAWFYCGVYNMPWVANGSWMNNQYHGTQAIFYNSIGAIQYITPPAFSSSSTYNWTPIYKIRPC